MCGIAGILDLDGHVSTDSSDITRMADAMLLVLVILLWKLYKAVRQQLPSRRTA